MDRAEMASHMEVAVRDNQMNERFAVHLCQTCYNAWEAEMNRFMLSSGADWGSLYGTATVEVEDGRVQTTLDGPMARWQEGSE